MKTHVQSGCYFVMDTWKQTPIQPNILLNIEYEARTEGDIPNWTWRCGWEPLSSHGTRIPLNPSMGPSKLSWELLSFHWSLRVPMRPFHGTHQALMGVSTLSNGGRYTKLNLKMWLRTFRLSWDPIIRPFHGIRRDLTGASKLSLEPPSSHNPPPHGNLLCIMHSSMGTIHALIQCLMYSFHWTLKTWMASS